MSDDAFNKHANNGTQQPVHFSGRVYLFHAFDVGDDINIEKVLQIRSIHQVPSSLPKYFKNYHTPISIELPHPHQSGRCISCKIHNFGAISLTYEILFAGSLEDLRRELVMLTNQYHEQSVIDAKSVFRRIDHAITQPKFFQMSSSYVVIQANPTAEMDVGELKRAHGSVITSMLRFETEALAEPQKNEILESAIGYFRGDLIIIDTDAAFVYDDEYIELLGLFEFANIQQLELRFFDRLLDQELNKIYEGEGRRLPFRAYLPFVVNVETDPVARLGKLKVDILVITERLESSVKLAGEPYLSELYETLKMTLDIKNWQNAIERKLNIVHDIQSTFQNKIDVIRNDLLSVLVVILIFIELLVGLLNLIKH